MEGRSTARIERHVAALADAARAISAGEAERARECIAPIAGERWTERVRRHARIEPSSNPDIDVHPRAARAVSDARRAAVFVRDGFLCAFCGGRAVPRSVLVAFSDAFPEEIPYDPHYGHARVHPVYWLVAPEADHRLAHSRGGGDGIENLVTLHALCNTAKSDLLAEELPISGHISRAADDAPIWDGLISHYRAIVELGDHRGARHASPGYHQTWLRRFGV